MIATLTTRLRRTSTTAAALALLAVPLSACTTHTTDFVYTPAQGTNDRDGQVDVLNALVVAGSEGEGRFIAGLANNSPTEADGLSGITAVDSAEGVTIAIESGDTDIPASGFLQLADPESANVVVSGEEVAAGGYVRLRLEFDNAEPVEVNVPVVAAGEDFAGVTSGPSEPTESPTVAETETHSE